LAPSVQRSVTDVGAPFDVIVAMYDSLEHAAPSAVRAYSSDGPESRSVGTEGTKVVVVMAALPTAQNIFTYSLRYDRGVYLTRDTIFITTLASAPVILLAALIFRGA
jgi:predicted permease